MKYFFLTLFLILFINVTNYSQQYYCSYFPMELGKYWTYISQDCPDSLVSSIVDTATIKGKFYYSFAPYGTNSNWPRYWLRPDPQQIFALNLQDTSEYLLFDFQVELNESWEIPADSSSWNLPVNQCDFGKTITLFRNSERVVNSNRIFNSCFLFGHFNHPCQDAGIGNTWFENDFGMVRFSQVTEGGVLDWDLIVEVPDTTFIIGEYSIKGNPCLTVPCIPGVVSAVEATDTVFVLESGGSLFWNGEFSWNGYVPNYGDSVIVTGIITDRTDVFGKQYFTLEVLNFANYPLTSVSNSFSKNGNMRNHLKQNYPNPFNPVTKIDYVLSEPCNVKIIIYDSIGRQLNILVNEYKYSGTYDIVIDGKDLSSGIYFYQLVTNSTSRTKSMILLK